MAVPTSKTARLTKVDFFDLATQFNALEALVARVPAPTGVAATDTSNIQAALDTAGVLDVRLREGTYLINAPLRLRTYQSLRGVGKYATTLKCIANYNDTVIRFHTNASDKVTVADLTIDGDALYATRTNHHGIVMDNTGGPQPFMSDSHHSIERVRVQRIGGHGIFLGCSTGATPEQRATHLTQVEVYNAGLTGISISGVTDGQMVDVTVAEAKQEGVYLGSPTLAGGARVPVANWRIVALKAFYSGYGTPGDYRYGIRVNALRNTFVACEAQDCSSHGFYVEQPDNAFYGCIADNNGERTDSPAAAGYYVATGALRTRIDGLAPNYRGLQDYAVWLEEPAQVSVTAPPQATAFLTGSRVADSQVTLNGVTLVSTRTVTGSYTLVAADAGRVIEVDSASAATITVPANVLPVGTLVEVVQVGAGRVTIAAGSGMTLQAAGGLLGTRAQFSSAGLRARSGSVIAVAGDLS